MYKNVGKSHGNSNIRLYFDCLFSDLLLVTGGEQQFQGTSMKNSEVIDLDDSTNTCQDFSDYPFEEGFAALGMLNNIPVVCNKRQCQGLGQKFEVGLYEEVGAHTSIRMGDTLWFAGEDNIMIVRSDESSVLGPSLPQIDASYVRGHCVVQINQDEFMIIGGSPDRYQATWKFKPNSKTENWIRGPDTNDFRCHHACGLFFDVVDGKQKILIAGGSPPGASPGSNKDTTEILDFEVANPEWIYGK